jgi:hypothetical protein
VPRSTQTSSAKRPQGSVEELKTLTAKILTRKTLPPFSREEISNKFRKIW